jgi:transposase-like protein
MTEPLDTTEEREGSVSLARPINRQKPYPEEFKREAVELLRTSGRPLAQIARELGVSTESLRLWRKQAEIDAGKREGLSSEEREEPRRLRHENHLVKRTRIWVSSVVAVVAVAAAVVFLVVPLPGSGGDDGPQAGKAEQAARTEQAVDGSFVGKVSRTKAFVAVVAAPAAGEQDSRAVQVYVSDGRGLSEWLSGSILDNSFVAKSEDGDTEAKGKLSGDSVTGTVELPGGKTVRYEASPPAGAAGLYDLTVSSDGKLSGVSAAGLAVKGKITLRKRGTGMLKLADGERLEFDVTRNRAGDLIRLRAGQVRLIVLPGGQVRGVGKSRPTAAGGGERGFFIRSSS